MNNNDLNERLKVLTEKNDDLLAQTKVLQDQLQVKHVVIDTHVECHEKYAKLKAERYEYMIRYSALCGNDKKHRKQIVNQEVLFNKMSVQLVELDKHVRDLKNTVLEKDFKISKLEEYVCNKDLEIEKCLKRLNVCENKNHKMGQTNQTVHMIKPSKDTLYNGRKGIGFENPKYFKKAKDLRPSLYDGKVIGLGYTMMFLTHSNEALEIEKFKRSRENKIEFAYDYGNLNASYVNEKINFEDDYFQEITNLDFKKNDSPFQQTSSLKPYVPNVILEKIIIDLEDEVVSLLEKDKANLKTIESLKSKGFESSENIISELENESENDCLEVEKECDKVENSKVITPGMFKLSVSQSVSPISMLITSCESKNVKNLDTISSVRRPKHSDVVWKKKRSSNTSNVVLSYIVQICFWIIDSGCSKHMTSNRALLTNFMEKFIGTVRFGNNNFAVIAGYEDVVIGSMTIKKVYYVECLGHNLFSVGQFCDKGLDVAFRKSTCAVRNEDCVDLLTGDRSSNLYTIALNEVASNSLTFLLAKASSSQSWLWHQRLSHLNFATINNLMKNNLVQGLPKMKFEKDHLCSTSEQGKIHRKHHKSKTSFASNKPLYLLHMDLCSPMRVQSING
nr:copia protein [Tanacetum cinerariifolium]